MQKITRYLFWIILGVVAYLPFHALISTLFISIIGGKLPVKGIKELVVLLVILPLIYVVYKKRRDIKGLNPVLLILISAFLLIHLTIAFLGGGTLLVKVAGLISGLRFLGLFMACYFLSILLPADFRPTAKIYKTVVFCSLIVVAFGALQVLILPKDFLTHFGYGPTTIAPYGTVDNNQSFVRILSTLRGPNPLGAYLAFIAPLALVWYWIYSKRRYVLVAAGYALAFMLTIYGSQSRGGWLAFIFATGITILCLVRNKKLVIAAAVASLVLIGLVVSLKNSRFVSITLLHNDPSGSSIVKSDEERLNSIKRSVDKIEDKPFGHGEGTSGPASMYGPEPVIIENSYLDITYQIGWLGGLLFIAINIYAGYLLYKTRTWLGYALVAGLVAISINALLWPVWTDETISMIWWALAGFALGAPLLAGIPKKATVNERSRVSTK